MMSLADPEKDVVVAVCDIVGVFGVVPIDVVFAGVLGIVPNEAIFIGVLGSVPVDTIVVMVECKRMVVGCRSSRVSIIPSTVNDASLVVWPIKEHNPSVNCSTGYKGTRFTL